jgi:hypothetical protein
MSARWTGNRTVDWMYGDELGFVSTCPCERSYIALKGRRRRLSALFSAFQVLGYYKTLAAAKKAVERAVRGKR